jgi:hypothetical protein
MNAQAACIVLDVVPTQDSGEGRAGCISHFGAATFFRDE